jgi:hypothetical protein
MNNEAKKQKQWKKKKKKKTMKKKNNLNTTNERKKKLTYTNGKVTAWIIKESIKLLDLENEKWKVKMKYEKWNMKYEIEQMRSTLQNNLKHNRLRGWRFYQK